MCVCVPDPLNNKFQACVPTLLFKRWRESKSIFVSNFGSKNGTYSSRTESAIGRAGVAALRSRVRPSAGPLEQRFRCLFFRKFHPIFLCLLGQQLTKTPHKCCTFGRNSETPRGRKSLAHTHARTISTGTVPLKRSGKTRDDGETPFFFLFQKKPPTQKRSLTRHSKIRSANFSTLTVVTVYESPLLKRWRLEQALRTLGLFLNFCATNCQTAARNRFVFTFGISSFVSGK